MLWFLIVALVIWVVGHIMQAPVRLRLIFIALLYAAILFALALDRGAFSNALGVTLAEWLVLGGAAIAIWGYRAFLGAMRKRANQHADKTLDQKTFSDAELDRYARHIVMRELGGPGQKALKNARVLVIGAGGLGAPALQYLAAAGVGTIGIIDDDQVDNSNLQRQVIHKDASIGMAKVHSARAELLAQNPHIEVLAYNRRLSDANARALFEDYDVILDGSDNFETRYLANDVAAKLQKPLVSGALSQWEGQISIFNATRDGPCYACVFPKAPAAGLAPTCAQAGVLGPLPGVIGAMMAVETVKLIAQAGETLVGRMLIYDALDADIRIIAVGKRGDCAVCGSGAES